MSKTLVLVSGAAVLAGCAPKVGDATPAAATSATPTFDAAPSQYFTSSGARIRYKSLGAGEPLLLLHGWTDRAEMWAVPAEALARDFRVIVPDIRGFGESSKFADPNEYGRKMVSDMHALFDHLGIQKAHVMGYSMGALIAAQLALDDPQRVMTVSLVAGPFAGDSAAFAAIVAPLVASLEAGEGLGAFFRWQMPTWSDSAIAEIVPQIYAANDHDALVASMKALSSLMLDPARVKGSAVPAFIIVSKVDAVAPHARYLAGMWPNARLVELDTHDHSDIHLAQEVLDGFRQLVKSQSR